MDEKILLDKCWRGLIGLSDHLREQHSARRAVENGGFQSLTINQARMVITVHKLRELEPGGSSLKTIAERLGISAAAASEMVDSLVRKGMLERRASENDRRAVCISLSPRVAKSIAEAEASCRGELEALLARLPHEEVERFASLLNMLFEAVKEKNAEGR